MKSTILVCALLGLANAAPVTGAAESLEPIKFLSYLPAGDAGSLPYLVAVDQGYFKDAGLSPSISRLPSSSDISGAQVYLIGRALAYGFAARRSMPGRMQAFNVNLQDDSHGDDAVLVKAGSQIDSVARLDKGRPIGVIQMGGSRVIVLKEILKANGRNPEDFTFVDVDESSITDASGEAAPETVYAREPFKSILLARGGWKILVDGPLYPKHVFSPWGMSMTLFPESLLKNRPETAMKVVSVYDRALAFIRENPEKARRILAAFLEKKYGIKDAHPGMSVYATAREIGPAAIQRQINWYAANGLIPRRFSAESLLYLAEPQKEAGNLQASRD